MIPPNRLAAKMVGERNRVSVRKAIGTGNTSATRITFPEMNVARTARGGNDGSRHSTACDRKGHPQCFRMFESVQTDFPGAPRFGKLRQRLVARRLSGVRRLGKRVVFDVDDGSNLVIEPRMTGLVLLADPPDTEHLRLRWDLEGRDEIDSFWFWDRRGLGTVRLFEPGTLGKVIGAGQARSGCAGYDG